MNVSKTIKGENTFSETISLSGQFNFSLSGVFDADVYVQRSFDDGATWQDAASFTAPGEYVGDEPEADVLYRFGVKSFRSGEVSGRLGQ